MTAPLEQRIAAWLSAEVRHDGEKQRTRLAAASIVAAQLATIIGPPAARTDEKTAVL